MHAAKHVYVLLLGTIAIVLGSDELGLVVPNFWATLEMKQNLWRVFVKTSR